MRSLTRRFLLPGALLALAACATTRSDSDKEFGSTDLLTLDQITSVRATNAYEAVERLKSHWLRPKGRTQMPAAPGSPQFQENPVMVYLDDQRLGGVDHLRTIEIGVVQYIRHFPAAEAAARWGFDNAGGAILVSTRPLDHGA